MFQSIPRYEGEVWLGIFCSPGDIGTGTIQWRHAIWYWSCCKMHSTDTDPAGVHTFDTLHRVLVSVLG
jgi:hypothetical protein